MLCRIRLRSWAWRWGFGIFEDGGVCKRPAVRFWTGKILQINSHDGNVFWNANLQISLYHYTQSCLSPLLDATELTDFNKPQLHYAWSIFLHSQCLGHLPSSSIDCWCRGCVPRDPWSRQLGRASLYTTKRTWNERLVNKHRHKRVKQKTNSECFQR